MNFDIRFPDDLFKSDGSKINTALPTEPLGRGLIGEKFGRSLAEYLDLDITVGPWLAGGAVRCSYINEPIGHADWDIWFNSAVQFDNAEKLIRKANATMIYSSTNAITFRVTDGDTEHNVQLIRRKFFRDAKEIIDQFDFTICQLVTDGDNLLLGQHTALDLENKLIRSVPTTLQAYIIPRLIKYMAYGYYPSRQLLALINQQSNDINWTKNYPHDYDAT